MDQSETVKVGCVLSSTMTFDLSQSLMQKESRRVILYQYISINIQFPTVNSSMGNLLLIASPVGSEKLTLYQAE